MNKICPKCQKKQVQKYGRNRGCQAYKCNACLYRFRSPKRIRKKAKSDNILYRYSIRKQTLKELSDDAGLSVRTIHRKISTILDTCYHEHKSIILNPNLSKYTQSVLILDATFF